MNRTWFPGRRTAKALPLVHCFLFARFRFARLSFARLRFVALQFCARLRFARLSLPRLSLSLLTLALLSLAFDAGAHETFRSEGRVVAIGDVHGDYERLVEVLRAAGLIDDGLNWSGGNTHLVQTGDIPDRGWQTRKVFDLLMKLEDQAASAKGRIHALIGNHEAMNLYGDLQYVSRGEYEEFRDLRSAEVRKTFYERALEEFRGRSGEKADAETFRARWEEEHPLGYFEHRQAYGPTGKYGKWIREHAAMVVVDDSLFLHGGISPTYADIPGRIIDERIRAELADFTKLRGGVVQDSEGPLWYRGLAYEPESQLRAHVENVLRQYGVKRVVVGHTPTLSAVLPRFGGKVILIDVGLSEYFGGPPACLLIENGVPYALHRGKKLRIPNGPRAALIEYLNSAAALDPAPPPGCCI